MGSYEQLSYAEQARRGQVGGNVQALVFCREFDGVDGSMRLKCLSRGNRIVMLSSVIEVDGDLELTVEDLKEQVWSYELVTGPGSYKSIVQDINGERVVTYLRNEAGTVITNEIDATVPLLVDGAAVSFDLIGRRVDRRNVVDWFGNVLEIPADEYLSVGGGIGGTQVAPGVRTLVDVTAAMQAIVRLRASQSAVDGYELWPSFGVSRAMTTASLTAETAPSATSISTTAFVKYSPSKAAR
jgi:hypothetical protein